MNNNYYFSIAEEIRSKIDRLKHLVPKGNLASGEYHEEIIRNTLRNFLPDRYSVKRGYIYLKDEVVSQQTDIIIIDENEPYSYLFKDRDLVVVRPESVIAAIEVKTTLDINEFEKSFKNIFNTKLIKKKSLGYYGHIFGAVIGFKTNVKKFNNKRLDSWFKKIKHSDPQESHAILWPDVFLFFDEGMFLYNDHHKQFDQQGEYYYKLFRANEEKDIAWQITLFITLIIAMCENEDNMKAHLLAPAKVIKNFDFSIAQRSHDRFRPEEGHSRLTSSPDHNI